MIKVPIAKVKNNRNNPRTIKSEKFEKLVKSIKEFPQMLDVRPIVVIHSKVEGEYIVLGGNMRLKACKEARLKEVPIEIADGWSKEKQDEFIVKDNLPFGEWDYELLKADYDLDKLEDWGLEIKDRFEELEDVKQKNPNQFQETQTLRFTYPDLEYLKVKEKLMTFSDNPELALLKVLELV